MDASIIIRTYNESRHLPDVLRAVAAQRLDGMDVEVVVVDSGSDDGTQTIAQAAGCGLVEIAKQEFSFGRSLNRGCEAARGRFLIFISGHCIPVGSDWLGTLLRPLVEKRVSLVYGRQVGGAGSRYSECRIFDRYYPGQERVPQEGYFNNNANAALHRAVWSAHRYDESLTGLEDLEFGKRISSLGMKIGYVAGATVRHLHDESWLQVRTRFEREAIALQHIMPEIHLSSWDFLRYLSAAVAHDWKDATGEGRFAGTCGEILMYRLMQYWGAFRGNHDHRRLSSARKERYFYPR